MRRRKIWLDITGVIVILVCLGSIGLAIKADDSIELMVRLTKSLSDDEPAVSYRPQRQSLGGPLFRKVVTPFFQNMPEKDPQKRTDSLVEDIREIIKSNN